MQHGIVHPQYFLPQLDLAARDPADVEQVIDDVREVLNLPLNDALRFGSLGGGLVPSQIQRVDDRPERIAELVREHRKELVHLPFVLLQRLDAAAIGEIARDLCKPAQPVVAVVERSEEHTSELQSLTK